MFKIKKITKNEIGGPNIEALISISVSLIIVVLLLILVMGGKGIGYFRVKGLDEKIVPYYIKEEDKMEIANSYDLLDNYSDKSTSGYFNILTGIGYNIELDFSGRREDIK